MFVQSVRNNQKYESFPKADANQKLAPPPSSRRKSPNGQDNLLIDFAGLAPDNISQSSFGSDGGFSDFPTNWNSAKSTNNSGGLIDSFDNLSVSSGFVDVFDPFGPIAEATVSSAGNDGRTSQQFPTNNSNINQPSYSNISTQQTTTTVDWGASSNNFAAQFSDPFSPVQEKPPATFPPNPIAEEAPNPAKHKYRSTIIRPKANQTSSSDANIAKPAEVRNVYANPPAVVESPCPPAGYSVSCYLCIKSEFF